MDTTTTPTTVNEKKCAIIRDMLRQSPINRKGFDMRFFPNTMRIELKDMDNITWAYLAINDDKMEARVLAGGPRSIGDMAHDLETIQRFIQFGVNLAHVLRVCEIRGW